MTFIVNQISRPIENTPKECLKLREKILTEHKNNFKEKLGPLDRINHPPVKLKID